MVPPSYARWILLCRLVVILNYNLFLCHYSFKKANVVLVNGICSRMKLRLVGRVKYRKYYKITRIVRKLGQTPLICSTLPSSYNYE